ncbi:carboxypeptidase N subunit 2-like [Chironomus tepperi]|uniref:carboxypeptidase N subunit 2-like n=1 Tax=Chironomus tepperi TaxID=113505 RepID=UPI00391F0A31
MGQIIIKKESEMKVKCRYEDYTYVGNKNVYQCEFDIQTIPENITIIPDGTHQSASRGNEDVDSVLFVNCNLSKVPQGLTKTFPNLKVLNIWSSGLKTVTKTDLAEYKNLERIYISYSAIKFLPGDLFKEFKNLEAITIDSNKVELIEPNILDGLDKLKIVNFR